MCQAFQDGRPAVQLVSGKLRRHHCDWNLLDLGISRRIDHGDNANVDRVGKTVPEDHDPFEFRVTRDWSIDWQI